MAKYNVPRYVVRFNTEQLHKFKAAAGWKPKAVIVTQQKELKIGPWDLSSLATTCLHLVRVGGGVWS